MSTAASHFTLRLFPDTGHQFFSLDLEELLLRRCDAQGRPVPPPAIEHLRRFVEVQQPDKVPRGPRRERVAGWVPWSAETPWILYRYDLVPDPRFGSDDARGTVPRRPVLLLAIESNLGDFDRGVLLGLNRAGDKRAHPAHEFLRRFSTAIPEPPAEATLPYFSRPADLRTDWPEGGLWLEDVFPNPQTIPLPNRLTPQERREFQDFTLPRETVRIEWAESEGDRPVDVDLIVDLGNSRTVALLLEDHGADVGQMPFGKRVEPVHFLPRGWSFAHPAIQQSRRLEPYGIIDSWILVHRSTFANLEPPYSAAKLRTLVAELGSGAQVAAHLIDQRFTSLAPVLMGGGKEPTGAIRTLARAALAEESEGKPFFLSSPKRYAWDNISSGSTGTFWKQVPNAHDRDSEKLSPLGGMIRLVMNPSSRENDLLTHELHDPLFDPPSDFLDNPRYSRGDAICWFALAIIEAAYRQINSVDFLRRTFPERCGLIRRLRNVRVTYPAGWTGQERERYLDQWRRAISLFALGHLARGDQLPVLVKDSIDEAVASQLPIVVSEIKNLANDACEWLTLYGDGAEARLLSLDIGGGTTDIAVVGYSRPADNLSRGELVSTICYRDGTNIAGDVMVKTLIERFILPAWLKLRGDVLFGGNAEPRRLLESLFRSPNQQSMPLIEAQLSQILRLALIPLANEVLARVNDAERAGATELPPLRVSRVADAGAIDDLNRLALRHLIRSCCLFGDLRGADLTRLAVDSEFRAWYEDLRTKAPHKLPFPPDGELVFPLAGIHQAIDDVFTPTIRSLSRVIHEQQVNLVVVSGKPSELLRMRTILHRELPLPAQRIIQARGHWVGDWYPVTLVEDGRIRDAKTVTVTGAALYEDILHNNTTGFRLQQTGLGDLPRQDTTWGVLAGLSGEFDELYPYFEPDSKGTTLDFPRLSVGTVFGRRLTQIGRVEPVYRLDYVTTDAEAPDGRGAILRAKLRRVDRPHGEGDALELVPGSVSIVSGPPGLDLACVQLRLRTMIEDSFWMDLPRFAVDFSGLGSS